MIRSPPTTSGPFVSIEFDGARRGKQPGIEALDEVMKRGRLAQIIVDIVMQLGNLAVRDRESAVHVSQVDSTGAAMTHQVWPRFGQILCRMLDIVGL